jgi:hypothetical protein
MTGPRLRIYCGHEAESTPQARSAPSENPTVSVPLRDVLPFLAEAYRSRRLWLDDFHDEEIVISADLYDVLLAYESLHRPSA